MLFVNEILRIKISWMTSWPRQPQNLHPLEPRTYTIPWCGKQYLTLVFSLKCRVTQILHIPSTTALTALHRGSRTGLPFFHTRLVSQHITFCPSVQSCYHNVHTQTSVTQTEHLTASDDQGNMIIVSWGNRERQWPMVGAYQWLYFSES